MNRAAGPESAMAALEAMAALATEMRRAAAEQQWDTLAQLEARQRVLRQHCQQTYGDGLAGQFGDADSAARAEALIARIQDADREVRSHVEPWMTSVRKLLRTEVQASRMRSAYGASHR